MAENQQTVFRKQTIDRISSPEQLTDHLRVTSPGIWVVLAAVILLLTGILVWSAVGTLETKAEVKVIVEDREAQIVPLGPDTLEEGMTVTTADSEFVLSSVDADEYGRSVGSAAVTLPDGIYDGTVVTESVHPIEFLLTSR